MAQSFHLNYIHLIFSTKERRKYLQSTELRDAIYSSIQDTLRELECETLAINGHHDHAHVLFALNKNHPATRVVREVKRVSSKLDRALALASLQSEPNKP